MDEQQKKTIGTVVIAVAIATLLAWLIFGSNAEKDGSDNNDVSRVSGELVFDALKPERSDNGTLIFSVRKNNTGDIFSPATTSVTPSFDNGGAWMIEDLEEGVTYDIQTALLIDGEEITKSEIATATAPASDVNLNLTITWSNLPSHSVEGSKNKEISGAVNIAGYIPDGAFYAIFTAPSRDESDLGAEEVDDPQFTRVITGEEASVNNDWVWDKALSQVKYLVRAELYTVAGDYIGTSNIVDAVVPQNNILLTLQSKAIAEPEFETLSGTVRLNGSYKNDSTVLVQVRENGIGGFFDVDSFPAESNRSWDYDKAMSGIKYDVRAVLQRKGDDVATSKQRNTTAPATNINLTIDTSMNLVAPSTKPDIVSCSKREDGKYNAELNFPGINKAESYWVRIGKEKYSGDRFNEPERPSSVGSGLNITIRIDKSKHYYTDYAYSYCKDCTTLDSYSEFSSSLEFYCGDDPEIK